MPSMASVRNNDDSIHQKYRYIVFDIDILYRIVASKRISRYIAIFLTTSQFFLQILYYTVWLEKKLQMGRI